MAFAFVRFAYNFDAINASTVSASSTFSADLAASNVVNDQVQRVWRSTGVAAEYLTFDMGSSKSFTVAAIFGHTFTATATVTLLRSSDGVTYTSVGTLPIITDSDGNALARTVLFFGAASFRYWKITIADAGNAAGHVDVGRVVLSNYYEPPRNFSDNYAVEYTDPSEVQYTSGRAPFYRQQILYRRITLNFGYLTNTVRAQLWTIFLKTGNTKPMVLSLDPTNNPAQESAFCSLFTPLRLVSPFMGQTDAVNLVFEERG